MPLESFSFITSLNAANPAHTDGLSIADSHMRGIKSTLLASFPAVAGAVTASHTDLNQTTGLTGALALKSPLASPTFTGTATFATLNATNPIKQNGNVLIPTGIIALWTGTVGAIPAGWLLCNGLSGTPDLRDRFVIGAGGALTPGSAGGLSSQTTTLVTAGAHTHTGATGVHGGDAQFASADVQGSHNHTGITAGYALTINDIPSHSHGISSGSSLLGSGASGVGSGALSFGAIGPFIAQGGGAAHAHGIVGDGAHSHNITVSSLPNHTHPISSDGGHVHTVNAWDNRPAYYALCYIMKT